MSLINENLFLGAMAIELAGGEAAAVSGCKVVLVYRLRSLRLQSVIA